jgi:hypothetical protein
MLTRLLHNEENVHIFKQTVCIVFKQLCLCCRILRMKLDHLMSLCHLTYQKVSYRLVMFRQRLSYDVSLISGKELMRYFMNFGLCVQFDDIDHQKKTGNIINNHKSSDFISLSWMS